MKKFTVEKPQNLKDFTDCVYPQGSFYFNTLLKKGDIKVNGERVKTNLRLNLGDEVTYFTTSAQENKPSHEIIFEDGNIAVADKFSGVSFEGLLSELNFKGKYLGVHRLDRNTSGVIIFAKCESAQTCILNAFKERAVEKRYLALCKNKFPYKTCVLSAYLKKDGEKSEVKISFSPEKGYEKIITEVSVLDERGDIALVGIILHTGKTHQIRAHLAAVGCPVLGDEKYGDTVLNKKYKATRQRLVSKSLKLNLNGELSYLNEKIFESPQNPEI